jgi:hypothetical protein
VARRQAFGYHLFFVKLFYSFSFYVQLCSVACTGSPIEAAEAKDSASTKCIQSSLALFCVISYCGVCFRGTFLVSCDDHLRLWPRSVAFWGLDVWSSSRLVRPPTFAARAGRTSPRKFLNKLQIKLEHIKAVVKHEATMFCVPYSKCRPWCSEVCWRSRRHAATISVVHVQSTLTYLTQGWRQEQECVSKYLQSSIC